MFEPATVTVEGDGEFYEYVFDVGRHKLWTGKTVTAIRLDRIEGGDGEEFEVEYIRGK